MRLGSFRSAPSWAACSLGVGRKSASVVVTGCEDGQVRLWAVGDQNPILTLAGHQKASTCVCFNRDEDIVLAGSRGGAVKVWDLESGGRLLRTVPGHKSSCSVVDCHPLGEIFLSGAVDATLKLWDVRQKNCVQMFKGHVSGITTARFSSNGRYAVSGSEDGAIKLWDLAAGRCVASLEGHGKAVLYLELHRRLNLLASSSADRTAIVWDLDTFNSLGQTEPEATAIDMALFHAEDDLLLTSSREILRSWSWKGGMSVRATANVGWSGQQLHDASLAKTVLVGGSSSSGGAHVDVWTAEIDVWARGNSADRSPLVWYSETLVSGNNAELRAPSPGPGAALRQVSPLLETSGNSVDSTSSARAEYVAGEAVRLQDEINIIMQWREVGLQAVRDALIAGNPESFRALFDISKRTDSAVVLTALEYLSDKSDEDLLKLPEDTRVHVVSAANHVLESGSILDGGLIDQCHRQTARSITLRLAKI